MCAGCSKKTLEMAEKMKTEAKVETPAGWPPPREGINCYCGLLRLIPTGLKVDDIFELVPCPRCGMGFKGRLHEGKVEEILG